MFWSVRLSQARSQAAATASGSNATGSNTGAGSVSYSSDQELIADLADHHHHHHHHQHSNHEYHQPPQHQQSFEQESGGQPPPLRIFEQEPTTVQARRKMFIHHDTSMSMSSMSNHDHQFSDMDNYGIPYYFGDPLGIHDPSETELGGVGHENSGPFARKSGKIFRGLLLMIAVAVFWVATVHLFRMSFHRDRLLLSIAGGDRPNGTTSGKPMPVAPSSTTTTKMPEMLPPPLPLNKPKSKKRIWLNFSEFVPRSNFDAPYLVTWYCTIWNILYLPVYLMIHAYFLSRRSASKSASASDQATNSGTNSAISSAVSQNPFGSNVSNKTRDTNTSSGTDSSSATSIKKVLVESIQGLVDRGFTLLQFFYRCAFFCVLVTLANYMMIFSLRILDATVVMALLSSMVSIIYLLSWVVLHQQFVGIRIVGIIIVDTGVALLVYMDGVQHQTLASVMIAFGAAIIFGVYKVFMRRMIGYTTFAQMALFHSLVGLLNALLAWPLILVLYATGVEIIVWSEIPWLYLTGASLAAFMANMVASFGVICTYEFFLTSGIFFAIPISAVIDIYINSVMFRDMKLSGVLMIMAGFLVVLLPDNWNGYLTQAFRNRLKKWKRREENKKSGRVQDTTTGQLSRLRTSSGRVK